MKSTSQSGFAVGAALGIIAILALLGGGAYVASNKGKMATSTNATSTASTTGGFELNANENAQMNANANATTSLGKDVSADAKAKVNATSSTGGVNLKVNVDGGASY